MREKRMPELDEIRTDGGLGETIWRVVKDNAIEFLRDEKSDAVFALVPLARLRQLMEEANPKIRILRAHLRKLIAEKQERESRVQALAQKLAGQEEERRARR